MTQTPKQWAATGFIIGVASGIAAAVIIFFMMRNGTEAVAQPLPSSIPAAQNNASISGTIALDPSATGNMSLPAVVFVIARGDGLEGHPLLAKRLDVASFPVNFSLGSEDSMMGQAPPNRVSLEVRVDGDGDATTREPGAPTALLESVTLGTNNVKLLLRPKA